MAGIFERLKVAFFPNGKVVAKAAPVVSPSLTAQFWMPPRLFAGNDPTTLRPYENHNWVYAAISAKAQALAQIPFVLYRAPGSGKVTTYRQQIQKILHGEDTKRKQVESDEYEVIEDGPFYMLFQSPNPRMCRYDLWQAWMISMDLWGEAFWILESEGDDKLKENEVPAEIWPQNPTGFEPINDEKTKSLVGWKQNVDGKILLWEHHQVIQFRRWNPYDPQRGLAPICAAGSAIRQDSQANAFNESFLRNGAYPSGSLTTEKEIAEEQRRQLREQFEDRYSGATKAGRVLLLEKGLKFEAAAVSHKDMDFLEQRKWNREQILSVFKVPKIVVGVYEDINYATSQTAYRLFYQNAIIPDAKYIEDILLSRLFNPLTTEKEFGAFDLTGVEALRDDLQAKATTAAILWGMGVPFNEINEKLSIGFDPIDGGETGWIPIGVQPTLFAEEDFLNPDEPEPTPPTTPPKPQEEEDEEDEERGHLNGAIRKGHTGRTHAQIEARVTRPSEKEWLSKFRRYLFDLRSDQLRLLENTPVPKGPKPLDPTAAEAMLFARARWDAELKKRMKPAYESGLRRSSKQVATELDLEFSFDMTDPRVVEWFEQKLASLVQVNRTIQNSLRNVLAEEMSNGSTISEIQTAIRDRFNEISAGRALTIARTESGFATSFARMKTYETAGIEYLQWSTANDEAVRESHAEQDGVVVKRGETFPNGLHYPREHSGPPGEVINCFLPGTNIEGSVIGGLKAFYSGPAREIETRRGYRLRVTVNHPILTANGWVPSGHLKKGDQLFTRSGKIESSVLSDVKNQNGPTRIENVFDSISSYGTNRLAMVGGLDLHGDAKAVRGNVHIVSVNSELRSKGKSSQSSQVNHLGFPLTPTRTSVHESLGAFTEFRESDLSSTGGLPCRRTLTHDSGSILLEARPLQSFRIGSASKWDSALAHESKDRPTMHTEFLGELIRASAGEISLDDIVSIRELNFVGHVFDLQTVPGWILSENIVSSNCRCEVLAVEGPEGI